jgi:hypothetical protein
VDHVEVEDLRGVLGQSLVLGEVQEPVEHDELQATLGVHGVQVGG